MTPSTELTEQQRRIVETLRPVLGAETDALFEANGRSLRQLARFALESPSPGCRRLTTGLRLAQELLVEEMTERSVLDTPRAVADFLKLHFAGQGHESFALIYLDARLAMLAFEDLFTGTLTQTSVYPREVLKRALHHNAAGVILAHNHPSGSPEPSHADRVLTDTLTSALALVDVRVIDHLVVAGGRTLSFAERGLI